MEIRAAGADDRAGIEAVVAPLLVHETLPAELPGPEAIAAIALTSAKLPDPTAVSILTVWL